MNTKQRINEFVEKLQMMMNDNYLPSNTPKVTVKMGRKYAKIICRDSVYAFVDVNNGNIYKPAGWKAPAKHARGNIFDQDHGMHCCGLYGVNYLN